MTKKRKVTNHLGTVHAIAMCNMCELSAGLVMEASLNPELRWIPKGMNVQYLKKAETSLKAVAKPKHSVFQIGDNSVYVDVFDKNENIVLKAEINMYVSERPAKKVQFIFLKTQP